MSKSKFLLVGEVSPTFQARHAHQLGADEFINKPFSKADFLKAVESALESNTERRELAKQQDFVQVPLDEFVTGSTLLVDLYFRLSPGKHVKMGSRGGTLSPERIEGYRSKGLEWVYMKKEDFAFYVGFNMGLAKAAHSEARIECARKIRLTQHVTDTLITQICKSGVAREQLENASNVVMNAVELIIENPTTLKLLENIDLEESLPSHSIAVSIWACLIAKRLGWKGQSTFFKIALCALFHDVGQREIPEDILHKPRFELNQNELKAYQGHTGRGRDILRSVPGMPEDVAMVAFQHHELRYGGGYPQGLRNEQIHPLAGLIGIADHFCDFLKQVSSGGEMGLQTAFAMLNNNARGFDPVYFRNLREIIEEATSRTSGRADSVVAAKEKEDAKVSA